LDHRDRIDGLRRSGRLRLLVDGTRVAEFHCVASWPRRDARRIVIEHCGGALAEPVRLPPSFRTRPETGARR
jgi:hypothetical protein